MLPQAKKPRVRPASNADCASQSYGIKHQAAACRSLVPVV
jgi:hypothetical protein